MGLQRYVKPQKHFSGDSNIEAVTIRPNGQFTINPLLMNKRNFKQYENVILYCDPDERKVVIQGTKNPEEEGCVRLSTQKAGLGVFCASPFIKMFNISNEVSRRYRVIFDEKYQALSFSLDKDCIHEAAPVAHKKNKTKKEVETLATPETQETQETQSEEVPEDASMPQMDMSTEPPLPPV